MQLPRVTTKDLFLLRGLYEAINIGDGTKHPLDFAYSLRASSSFNWYSEPIIDLYQQRRLWHYINERAWEKELAVNKLDWRIISQHFARLTMPAQEAAFKYFFLFSKPQPERLTAMSVPEPIMLELNSKLQALEQALLAADPQMPFHLQQSHALIMSYPETTVLLTDAQSAVILNALKAHTKTEIVKPSSKAPSSKKKFSLDDL